jgi:DNA ligase-1
MKFEKLTSYFQALESTTKRLEMIEILCELLGSVDDAREAQEICYLLQGRVAPFYEPVELGMGERLVERAVSVGCGVELAEVQRLNKKLGDLGEVVESCGDGGKVRAKKGESGGVSVGEVFARLVEIANDGGEGSVERKVEGLAGLIGMLDVRSAKYVVRVPIGRLRLGVGDPTIMDALAIVMLGEKKYRKELERAYNEVSDLGLIAKHLFEEGVGEAEGVEVSQRMVNDRLERIGGLRVHVGRPLRSELCERLPTPEKTIEKMGAVVAQFKYDGFRTQIHMDRGSGVVRLFSRNLEETTAAFPDLVAGVWAQLEVESVILDAEAIAYRAESEEFLPFQETTKRRRKHGIELAARELPLRAFVFDLLYLNGESWLNRSVVERLEKLREIVTGEEVLIVAKSRIIDNGSNLAVMLEESLSHNLEGIVVKKVDSVYEAGGRNFNWVKLKHTASEQLKDTIDCVVLGYIFGRGKRGRLWSGSAFGGGV